MHGCTSSPHARQRSKRRQRGKWVAVPRRSCPSVRQYRCRWWTQAVRHHDFLRSATTPRAGTPALSERPPESPRHLTNDGEGECGGRGLVVDREQGTDWHSARVGAIPGGAGKSRPAAGVHSGSVAVRRALGSRRACGPQVLRLHCALVCGQPRGRLRVRQPPAVRQSVKLIACPAPYAAPGFVRATVERSIGIPK